MSEGGKRNIILIVVANFKEKNPPFGKIQQYFNSANIFILST